MGCSSSSGSPSRAVMAVRTMAAAIKGTSFTQKNSDSSSSSSRKSRHPGPLPKFKSTGAESSAEKDIKNACGRINTLVIDNSVERDTQIRHYFLDIVSTTTKLPITSLNGSVLDEVLRTINGLRLNHPSLASKLESLIAKCRILVEEKTLNSGPATLIRQASLNSIYCNPECGVSNKFQKLVSTSDIELRTDSIVTYDSSKTVAFDCSLHDEYGFYNWSTHDSTGEQGATKTTAPRLPRKIRYDASQLAAEGYC